MATAASARNVVDGPGGNLTLVSGSKTLTFDDGSGGPSLKNFKTGATIVVFVPAGFPGGPGEYYFTIDGGSGSSWNARQSSPISLSGIAPSDVGLPHWKTSDTSGSRARGAGYIVPNALHFLYRAPRDDGSNADFYFYFDTLYPENGVHPYTKDQFAGPVWFAAPTLQSVVPDLATRIRRLEGCVRAPNGATQDPDTRIDDFISRLVALEQWANRVGTNTPPSVGDGSTYTLDQLLTYGDN